VIDESIIVGVACYAIHRLNAPQRDTPDAHFYRLMSEGKPAPAPYCYRELVPEFVIRSAWPAISAAAYVASVLGVGFLAQCWGLTSNQATAAAALFAVLPMHAFNASVPRLVDPVAMALAVYAAIVAHVLGPGSIVLALLAGLAHERAPMFAAAYAMSPWPLLGLVANGLARLTVHPAPPPAEAWWLRDRPWRIAMRVHRGRLLDPRAMLLPWGGLAVLVPAAFALNPDPRLAAAAALALVLGYAQLAVATDRVRLYQWAGPAVCVLVASVVPMWAVWPAVVLTFFASSVEV
jgi:hypothetical protein